MTEAPLFTRRLTDRGYVCNDYAEVRPRPQVPATAKSFGPASSQNTTRVGVGTCHQEGPTIIEPARERVICVYAESDALTVEEYGALIAVVSQNADTHDCTCQEMRAAYGPDFVCHVCLCERLLPKLQLLLAVPS